MSLRELESWAIGETTSSSSVDTEHLLGEVVGLIALMDDGWRSEDQVRDSLSALIVPAETAVRR